MVAISERGTEMEVLLSKRIVYEGAPFIKRSSGKGISMRVPTNSIFVEGSKHSNQALGGHFFSVRRLSLQTMVQNKPPPYLMLR